MLAFVDWRLLAGALLLTAGWAFLSRVPHVGLIYVPGYRDAATVRRFDAPEALETRFYEIRARSDRLRCGRGRLRRLRLRRTL